MNETLQTIMQLRSERQFTEKPIDKEDLETILEASIRTANSSSRQAYSIIVITDQKKIPIICGFRGAALLVYCVDQNRLMDIAGYMKQDYEMGTTMDFLSGGTDAVLAAQTAVIAATSLGIDSLITNGVLRQNFHRSYELLNLPKERCFPMIGVVLGYSASKEKHYKERLRNGVIHYDTYQHMTDQQIEEEIKRFDDPEGKIGLTTYSQWEKMGYAHYYEWFYQVWNKRSEDCVYPILREVKFMD
jgi:FMN reductase [NAD(P)H]